MLKLREENKAKARRKVESEDKVKEVTRKVRRSKDNP